MSEMLTIISLGAGVQSSTMALMAAHGEIEPMPDCAIFADTQAEPRSVYRYLDWLEPLLPFPVHRVSRGNLAEDGLVLRTSGKSGMVYQKNLIPLFTLSPEGTKGMLMRKCTSDYKVRVIISHTRGLVTQRAVRSWRKANSGDPLVQQWIGISIDEALRMKPSSEPWIVNRWPLIEKNMSRKSCLAWMENKGYPQPPRSACIFCPYHNDDEWRRLRDEEPEEFERAVAWERRAKIANSQDEAARSEIFLHSSCVPLDRVDLTKKDGDPDQLNLFINECEGMCGV